MGNEDHLLARTAMLTGRTMFVSGAEIARVEDTVQYILSNCPGRRAQSMVFSIGIFVSLDSGDGKPITLVRRVGDRSTNLSRIYLANRVSRKLCGREMAPAEAYEELERIQAGSQCKKWLKVLNYMFIAFFFGIVLGGSPMGCGATTVTGGVLSLVVCVASRTMLNNFCTNVLGAFSLGLSALVMNRWLSPRNNTDVVIISAIMPLLPGVIFTAAMRDTLNGNYSSGAARMLGAIVTALAVAAGVGTNMALFHQLAGGGGTWQEAM